MCVSLSLLIYIYIISTYIYIKIPPHTFIYIVYTYMYIYIYTHMVCVYVYIYIYARIIFALSKKSQAHLDKQSKREFHEMQCTSKFLFPFRLCFFVGFTGFGRLVFTFDVCRCLSVVLSFMCLLLSSSTLLTDAHSYL